MAPWVSKSNVSRGKWVLATSHADEVVPECVVKHRWQCKSQSFLGVEIIHQWGHDI